MRLGALVKGVAVASLASVALTGCAADTGIVENTSITAAWNQPLYSFNVNTTSGNATANAIILYLTQQSFNYYNDQQELIRNEQFGTYELLSQDPLTVKYTINKGVTWTDGVAVDAADLLLNWASLSGVFNEGEPSYDEETGVIIPGDDVYFDSVAIGGGIDKATQLPEISEDGRAITLIYDEILVDWELLFTSAGLPAHVIAKHALGIDDSTEAKDAVIAAIQDDDAAALKSLADFWNLGFDYVEMPAEADQDILIGNGAYDVTGFVADEYITLKARGAEYKAGPQPKVETITVRYIPDALASIQALANGEVQITLPQATTDVVVAAEQLEGVTIDNQSGSTYEHIDLVFNGDSPFSPDAYEGDAAKAKIVRQAFLTAIDVNEVITKLIQPINPDAIWDQSQVFLPGAYGYTESAAANGSSDYGQGDADAAAAMLATADIATPIDVCFLFSSTNTRRVNEYQLYAEQVAPAGFNLVDCSSPSWGSLLGSGTYGASLFGWQSTSTAVTASEPTFRTDGGANFTGYSNAAIDALFDQLKGSFDKDTQIGLLQQIDALLWEDAYGMTVFQFPEVLVFDTDVKNVSSSPLSPNFFWNYWEWEAPVAVG